MVMTKAQMSQIEHYRRKRLVVKMGVDEAIYWSAIIFAIGWILGYCIR